jgi:dinuclear metal center YbgI/SA1388 family protein
MISRDLVTQTVEAIIGESLLQQAAKIDIRPNSVQLKGNPEVTTIAAGVSCSLAFLNKAVEAGANYVICHHGLCVGDYVINGRFDVIEERLKYIINNNLTVAGYHYALDAHPIIGNNAQIIEKLGAKRLEEPYMGSWGWVAEFSQPLSIEELSIRCEKITGHAVYLVAAGPQKIKRIGVCSGGARPHGIELMEIIDKHIDAHITGEISESNPYAAEGVGFHYLSCGHYATETYGIKALAEKLTEKFGINAQVKFIDVPSVL